jgi:hypothetical protein
MSDKYDKRIIKIIKRWMYDDDADDDDDDDSVCIMKLYGPCIIL